MNKIYLRKGKDIPIKNRHHWIFSGAIEKGFDFADGEIATVYSSSKDFIGFGYFNSKPRTLTGRMISFEKNDPLETVKNNLQSAADLRKQLFDDSITNCYRVINGEGDYIPGLVVDRYADVLVVQIGALGIEKIKKVIIDKLVEIYKPKCIYEKSLMPSRREEGMNSFEGYLYGEKVEKVVVIENKIKFSINLQNSHKTGFYLDQREMRKMVGELSNNKKVLNCFSYTGGFSLYAALNGAKDVCSIDISKEVIDQAKENFEINNLDPNKYQFIAKDVFDYIADAPQLDYDLIILDPPAFAKKKIDFENAIKGYRRINKETMRRMKKGSYLLTCSCSYNVDEESFQKVLQEAGRDTGRKIKILSKHHLAKDHLFNLFHSELNYLKCFLLYVE